MAARNEVAIQEHAELRILRRKQVEARTGLSRSTIYQLMAAGNFPRPVPLGTKAVGWPSDEVDCWIAARIAARDTSKAA